MKGEMKQLLISFSLLCANNRLFEEWNDQEGKYVFVLDFEHPYTHISARRMLATQATFCLPSWYTGPGQKALATPEKQGEDEQSTHSDVRPL